MIINSKNELFIPDVGVFDLFGWDDSSLFISTTNCSNLGTVEIGASCWWSFFINNFFRRSSSSRKRCLSRSRYCSILAIEVGFNVSKKETKY